MLDRARLVVACPDRPGVVATLSRFLWDEGANIVHSDQHTTDPVGGQFFMRIEFDLPGLEEKLPGLAHRWAPFAEGFSMRYRFVPATFRPRLAIFVSKEDHCLQELLLHLRADDIAAEAAMVVSNHEELREVAETFRVPFHHVPVTAETRCEAEETHLRLLQGVDVVVLARYMQILGPGFLERFPNRVINIHHSFLPAFVGANPYRQAHDRGVKLIGATAHYVTEELDAGPIIDQDVQRVDHRADVAELRRLGRQIERSVLARAVKWHCEDRIFVRGNRTVIFA